MGVYGDVWFEENVRESHWFSFCSGQSAGASWDGAAHFIQCVTPKVSRARHACLPCDRCTFPRGRFIYTRCQSTYMDLYVKAL